MTAKKDEKAFWLTSILLTVSELHVTFFISLSKVRFETYNHALPISLLRLKICLSKKTPHRRLKRNLSWVFRWKSVDITHHARVRYTNYCLKIAKSCGKNANKTPRSRLKTAEILSV